jgi:hypothetical protein
MKEENMARKPMQFQLPERLREDLEEYAGKNDMTLSELLRQSARIYILLRDYTDRGYELILRNKEENKEKEIVLP